MKWAVCSYSDRPQLTNISWPVMKDYCDHHGYTFEPYTHVIDPSRHVMWNKICILVELLNKGYDMVLWVDDDIVITEMSTSLEKLFSNFTEKQLALAAETTHDRILNTGIICARQGSQALLEYIYNEGVTDENRNTPGCEQWAMHILYPKIQHEIMLYPPASIQGFFSPEIPEAHWKKGTWSAHPAGLPIEDRVDILRRHAFTDEFILKRCGSISITSTERQRQTIESVTRVVRDKIEGDIIEIGVYKGGTVMIMLYTLLRLGEIRHVHLYDTFTGMTEAGDADVDMFGRKATDMWDAVKMECPLDVVKRNIESTGYPAEYIHYHVGDARQIKEAPNKIAILRLDVDWYDVYAAVLPVFEPNVSIDGIVTIDDYVHWKGCKIAIDEYNKGKNIQLQMIDCDSCFWIKKSDVSIPKIVFQTSREKLQKDVVNKVKTYLGTEWQYFHFTDEDIITFFNENPDPEFPDVTSKFHSFIKGTNKSDFFRAYFLYKKGGVFLDSDAIFTRNIEEIVQDYTFFSVVSGAIPETLFNGFMGCTKGHPIMYEHLKYLYYTSPLVYEKNYFLACYNLYSLAHGNEGVKLFNERVIYDTFVWETYDPENGQVLLRHYPFTKLVPTEYLRVYEWPNKIRLGTYMDGGYIIAVQVGSYDCYISCGIGAEESFSTEFVKKYNITKCFAFDGTVTQSWRDETPNIQYIRKNIGPLEDETTTNLIELISSHDDVFIKMDIEGSEFAWFEHIPSDVLTHIKQMTVEFHGINDDSWGTVYQKKRACFEKISQTHYIVHAHGNNWAPTTNHIPNVIELTFVRRDVFDKPPQWNTQKFPLQFIDRPNNPNSGDYFLGFPPFLDTPSYVPTPPPSKKGFGTRREMIQKLVPKHGTYAEVGVFKGEFTLFLQESLKPKKLYAIDLFEGVTGSGDHDGNNFSECQLEDTRRMLDAQGIFTIQGDSAEMIRHLTDNSLDMIYIDANHSFDAVTKDLEACFKKVKHGGWIMGHDYGMNMAKSTCLYACEPLQRAVNKFCKKYGQTIKHKAYDGAVSYAIQVSKIAICSLSDRPPVSDVSWPIMAEYCSRHGYIFRSETTIIDSSRSASWNKILLIRRVLDEGYQMVVWIDDDVIITERNTRLEQLLEDFMRSDMSMAVSGDNWSAAYFNAGIICAKQDSQEMLEHIWNDGVCEANKHTPTWEQWAMHTLYGSEESFRKKLFVYEPHYLQNFYKNSYVDMPEVYKWKPGIWSAHVSGIVNQEERVAYMKDASSRPE